MNILLINIICIIFHFAASSKNPIVKTANGKVQGFLALNETVNVFFGIPFAQPPIGKLRFEVENFLEKFKYKCFKEAKTSSKLGWHFAGK
jgi:carboxylesterase type B